MNSIAWWVNVVVLLAASAFDLQTRRIPNWLSIPFLVSGFLVSAMLRGQAGLVDSLQGFAIAVLVFGLPWFFRWMGLGDVKLAAGVGAWIGPSQFVMAFLVMSMVGGIMAVIYALRLGRPRESLEAAGELAVDLPISKEPRTRYRLGSAGAVAIPYAPAIAAGALFSFFAR
jgi:prepilin peptidase CpaA